MLCVLLGTLALASCDPGDIQLIAPESPPDTSVPFPAQIVMDVPYRHLAVALAWGEGVPDAAVRVHRADEPYAEPYWATFAADDSGRVELNGLLPGLYEVEVTRLLSPDEKTRSGTASQLLAGGRLLRLPLEKVETITVQPNTTGGLVFSEVYRTVPLPWESAGTYLDGKFFEFVNNGESTVYLDGVLFGVGWHLNRDLPYWPCSSTEGVRDDPDGIWFERAWRFPGSGNDYPVAPGEVVVLARVAVDHSPIHSSLLDLSHADFEFGTGYNNADNPDVPNLTEVSLRPAPSVWPALEQPLFLARPIAFNGLPSYLDSYSGHRFLRMPHASILDVVMELYDFTRGSFEPSPRCQQATHASFERLPGPAVWEGEQDAWSVQRRTLSTDEGWYLQDTNTSMVDFVRAPATPGWVPGPSGNR